jgi:uroporphyrinogen decarboxylase
VIAALNHQEADRIPIDFGSNFNTSVNVIAYNRLKRHLGIASPTYMRYTIPMLAAPDLDENREVLKIMGGDVLPVPRYYIDGALTKDWKEWQLKDGSTAMVPGRFNPIVNENGGLDLVFSGITQFRMPKGGFYFDRVYSRSLPSRPSAVGDSRVPVQVPRQHSNEGRRNAGPGGLGEDGV